ncbi:hypothetical protein ACFL2Q_05195 [Thermodesulfobacteriota bacterium]
MSPLKIPQVTLPSPDQSADLEQFVHGSDSPASLEEAFENARQALELTNSFNEVKDIRDQAETLRAHAKRAKWSLDIQNRCAEIKLRAERKAGSILSTFTVKGGERHNSHDGSCERYSILEDLGISWNQSSRWQAISRIPEDKFEDYILTARALNSELTQASALRLAARLKRDENSSDTDQKAKQNVERLMQTLSALQGHLERIQKDEWRFISKDEVRTKLEELLVFLQDTPDSSQ